jgi:YD repeat-containing protein
MKVAAFSQNVKFSYDASGNRVSRIIVTKSTNASINDTNIPIAINTATLKISVYPNPTTDIIHINCEETDAESSIDAYLFSSSGEMIHSFIIDKTNKIINLDNYATGIYYLKIRINEKVESWKIVKQ